MKFNLLERAPEKSVFEEIDFSSDLTITLERRGTGEHANRINSYMEQQTGPVVDVLCKEVSEFNKIVSNLGKKLPIRVIFIHTDLLGSQAADTDKDGDVL